MEANNPYVVAGALVLIALAIVFLMSMKAPQSGDSADSIVKTGLYPQAPNLSGIAGYINAEDGFNLEDAEGKVILVDFWTYSCINCIRTLPYLTAWDEKYRDEGLVIIGVHTPEFEFEKEYDNVKAAVEKHGIKYPVVLDNSFSTWRAYSNRFWPHKYLVDKDGFIRYDHIGEGSYDETEKVIQELLEERNNASASGGSVSVNATDVDFIQINTPEIYFGYKFALPNRNHLGNEEGFQPGEDVAYSIPQDIKLNKAYLEGTWKNSEDYMELVSESGKVVLKYEAKVVNIVAGMPANLTFTLDGKNLSADELGSDASLENGQAAAAVEEQDLYGLVDDEYSERTIEIEVDGKGFRIYTFTFG